MTESSNLQIDAIEKGKATYAHRVQFRGTLMIADNYFRGIL